MNYSQTKCLIALVLALIISVSGWGQERPIRADVVFLDTLTTTERDALTMRPSQFALIANSTVDSVQAWIVDKWVNLGSTGGGSTYTAGTGLTLSGSEFSVTNPFEAADETKLDGIATGATVGADWDVNLANIPPSIVDGIDASGFNGNLSTADDTVQEVAQAFDDLLDSTLDSPYTPANYTRASSTVRGQLQGIDAALGSIGGGTGDVTAASPFGTDNRLIKSDGTGKGVQSTGITIDDSNNVSGIGNLNMNTNSITNASSLSLSGRVNTPQVRFIPNNTIGNTTDQNSTGFKTGNIFYLQKVNESNELGFDFSALTADRTITFPDADVDLGSLGGGTPADDSITPAMMADGDHGAFTYVNNVAALDDNSVNATAIQDFAVLFSKLSTSAIASQLQAEAGTASNVLMTPERTAQAITEQAIRWHPDNADTSGRLFVGTVAQEAAGTFTANDIKIITDAPPANVITGTSIAMTAYDYLDDRAVDTNAFTFSDPDVGEITIIRLNQAGVPTFSGTGITFVQLDGTYQWEDNTDIKAYFEAQSATEIHYFFQKVQ